jgi:Fe-S oxidoreductase
LTQESHERAHPEKVLLHASPYGNELSLLPAVRQADAATLIVADGTSCRHQIADGTLGSGAKEAVHVAQVLAMALVKS